MFDLIIVLLAAALGAAHTLAFAPFGLWWLQPLALAGLFILAQRTSRTRLAALWGFAFGLGWFGAGVWWVFISMHRYGGLPPALAALATAVFCAWLALFPALALGLAARFQPRPYLHLGLALPACWLLAEWLRGVIFTGFPWLATGYAHTDGPLAGYAPLLGVYGVTGIAAALAASLALLGQRKPLGAALGAAIVLGGLGLGQINWASAHGERLQVRLIQGGVPQDLKFGADGLTQARQTHQQLLEAPGATPDVAVLPESVFPVPINDLPAQAVQTLVDYVTDTQATLLFGAFIEEPRAHFYNSVIALAPDRPVQDYRKRHLVPFGEFIPWGFQTFVDRMRIPIADQQRGAPYQAPITVKNQRIALNICYEDLFGAEIIQAWHEPEQAPHLLLNVSNLAWFDDSIALDQHLQISRMRALETARPMLRATNTGATALIDERGQVLARLPYIDANFLDVTVQGQSGLTPYVRWGNGPALALALGLLAIAWAGMRRQANRQHTS